MHHCVDHNTCPRLPCPACPAPPRPALQAHLEGVRATINSVASQWSRAEKDACIQETPHTFCWGGRLVQLITEGKAIGH